MTLHPQPGRSSIAPLVVSAAAAGFYVALFIVSLVIGDAAFNAAFPRPWRMLLCIPGAALPIVLINATRCPR